MSKTKSTLIHDKVEAYQLAASRSEKILRLEFRDHQRYTTSETNLSIMVTKLNDVPKQIMVLFWLVTHKNQTGPQQLVSLNRKATKWPSGKVLGFQTRGQAFKPR